LLVDRLGRRILLLSSIVGMTLSTAALGAYFFLYPPPPREDAILPLQETENNLGWLPITSLGFFLVFFAIGYGPLVWLMIGEVFSKSVNAVIGPVIGW
jgi:MFS family permease